jgi:hypothetical protein
MLSFTLGKWLAGKCWIEQVGREVGWGSTVMESMMTRKGIRLDVKIVLSPDNVISEKLTGLISVNYPSS